jgi:hypothetical protein
VWTQSNHFDEPGVSISASVAKIPWLTGAFRGFLVGMLHDGQLHRFTTYNGGSIRKLAIDDTHLTLEIVNRTHHLEIRAEKKRGGTLHAPYGNAMVARVAETMTSLVYVRLSGRKSGELLFSGVGKHGCLEMQGNLAFITDRVAVPLRQVITDPIPRQRISNASRNSSPRL